jgi:hypothetical protein
VVSRIRKARGSLQEDFELEEELLLVFDRELRKPGVPGRSVVGTEVPSAPEQLDVCVAFDAM